MKTYPELEKLTENSDFIRNIMEFAEYCENRGVWLVDTKTKTTVNPVDMAFEMLSIDEVEVEKQRQQLIKDKLGG